MIAFPSHMTSGSRPKCSDADGLPVRPNPLATSSAARIFEYIEVFYNRIRKHSSLGFQPPNVFERAG